MRKHYRYLYFTIQDTGLYETYFEGLSARGIHLKQIRCNRLAICEEGKPEKRKYRVFYNRRPYDTTREASDTAEGLSYKGRRGFFQCFGVREDVDETYLLQKQREREEEQYKIALQGKRMLAFGIVYMLFSIVMLGGFEAEQILYNSSMLTPVMAMAIGALFAIQGAACRHQIKERDQVEATYMTTEIKYRRAAHRGVIEQVLFLCIAGMCMLTLFMTPFAAIIYVLIMLPWLLFAWLGTHSTRQKPKKKKSMYGFVIGLLCGLGMMACLPFLIIGFGKYANQPERKQVEVARVIPLSLQSFTTYGEGSIRQERLHTGKSLCVLSYYEYSISMSNHDRLDVGFFDFKTEALATWYSEEVYLKEGYDTWTLKEHTGYQVDKVFVEEERGKLLLQKGNRVLYIDTDAIDFFEPTNQAVIEDALDREY